MRGKEVPIKDVSIALDLSMGYFKRTYVCLFFFFFFLFVDLFRPYPVRSPSLSGIATFANRATSGRRLLPSGAGNPDKRP